LPRKVVKKNNSQAEAELIVSEPEEDTTIPERNPKQVCELYPFQLKLAKSIYKAFLNGDYGALLRMNVGDGKTYVFGQVIRWLYDSGWIAKHKQFAPFPVCVFTKASIVEQTSRDLESEFGLQVPQEVLVINYEALRSKFGSMFIEEKTKVVYGEVVKSYHWRPFLNPVFVVLDEYQCLKNTDSTQSEIIQALNEVGTHDADSIVKANPPRILSSSATPFSRVSSAKVFAVSTRKKFKNLSLDLPLTNTSWTAYARNISSPSAPEEFCKAAVKRLVKDLRPYIYSPTHVYRKHKSINNVMLLEFETPEDTKQLNRVIKLYERWYFRKGNFSLPRKVVKENNSQAETELIVSEPNEEDSSIPERNPLQKCELYPFQLKLAKSIYKAFLGGDYGALLRMNVGDGKTYVFGQVIRWLYDSGWIVKHKQFAPFPVCVFTKASIVEQTSRDLESEFGLQVPQEVLVINYEALRSKFGSMFIEEKTKVVYGDVVKSYHWRPFLNPVFVVLDEYQCLKNTDSTQSEIIQALNEVGTNNFFEHGQKVNEYFQHPPCILSSSATPFSRVSSAKVFAVSTRKKFKNLSLDLQLTNNSWTAYARKISDPSAPEEFCKAAVKRLVKDLRPYIYSPTHVYRKHKSINDTMLIDFETPEERQKYNDAWETYLQEKSKIQSSGCKNESLLILVQFLKFRQAAELIRARSLARMMYNSHRQGNAVVSAMNFKPSIAKTIYYLNQDYNISRDQISIIWGGDARFTGNQERISPKEIQAHLANTRCSIVPLYRRID